MPTTDYERTLQDIIFPELETGRPNFDKPHTEAVIYYTKQIINNTPNLNLDKDVLIISAYAHDWGYVGLFKNGKLAQLENVKNVKKLHMQISAYKLRHLLKNPVFDFLSTDQKERAIHLVGLHDKLNQILATDEIVLMEADTLGGLDVNRVKPTFNKESNEKYMLTTKNKRYSRFITEYGKKEFKELFKLRENYYERTK